MRILCVNQYYWPDVAATGQLLQDLAEDLVTWGHEVRVLTGRAPYTRSGGRAAVADLSRSEMHNGVEIRRVGTQFGRSRIAGRLADDAAFHVSALIQVLSGPRVDVLLVQSSPPLILLGCAIAAKARGIPVVHAVQDLYPDIAVALGVLKPGGPGARALRTLQRRALHACRAIIVIGRDMAERVVSEYGCPADRVHVVPNWADEAALTAPREEVDRLKTQWGIAGRKTVMYSGNLGRAHSYTELLSVAGRWRRRDDVAVVFAGSGHAWGEAVRSAEREGLTNVLFLPYQERASLGASLSLGDVHLITQRLETAGQIVPSKIYPLLATGRAVVYVGPANSEIARLLGEAGVGVTVAPGDVDALERALDTYLSNEALRQTAAENGRSYIRSQGGRRFRTGHYRIILELAGRS